MRQFIAPAMPDKEGFLALSGKDFRYLHNVLRLRVGDVIHVRLPSGELRPMSVASLAGKTICLRCDFASTEEGRIKETGVTATQIEAQGNKVVSLWLFQFMPKAQKMDIIVRQATELGVARIVPIISLHSSKEARHQRGERWERIIREARQQSGSPVETKILPPCSLKEAVALWENEGGENPCGIVLYEKGEATQSFHKAVSCDFISVAGLVAGCEGGIAQNEVEILVEAGFKAVHLETNILRAETAAIYGLSVLQNLLTERHLWLLDE